MSSASSMPGFCPATAIFHNTGVQQLAASLTFSGKIVQLKADCGARENSLQTGYRSNASEPTFCKFFRESCAATSSEGHKMYRVLCNGLHFRIVETVIFAVARLFFTSHLGPFWAKLTAATLHLSPKTLHRGTGGPVFHWLSGWFYFVWYQCRFAS